MKMSSVASEVEQFTTNTEFDLFQGDSGGPLTIRRNGTLLQIGVTSRLSVLPICRVAFNNSVYTKVAAYIAWIERVTGIDFVKYHSDK